MTEVISFAGWDKFRTPVSAEYGLVFLALRTGVGKTVIFPPKLVGQQGGICIVVVPQQIHVRNNMNFHMNRDNNMNFHMSNSNSTGATSKILIQGLFHQYNKYTIGKQNGKSTLMNYRPRDNFSGEVVYITAGSLLRRLLSGSMKLSEIKYLVLDEVHVTENDYCTLIQVLNQISNEITDKTMPQLVLSSATLNDDVILRLSRTIEKASKKKSVRIENEATPYFIDVRYKHFDAISETIEFMAEKTSEAVGAWFRQGSAAAYNFEGNRIQPGILLHLPGKNECHEAGNAIYSRLSGIFKEGIRISYIYSGSEDVVGIYDKSEELLFNIIIATNADSGVTLPIGITIDSGFRKHAICFNNAEGSEIWSLRPVRESKSGMFQRRGRVGRTGDGICYHCVSEKEFAESFDNTTPETFRGENNELVLAILDAGFYFDSNLYNALPETIQRLIDLGLATPDALNVLEQRQIGVPHVYTTAVGQEAAKIPLPVLWAKMLTEAPFELKHAIVAIATFYSIQKHGGFFRGKTNPHDFQKRRVLMGESQIDFVYELWKVCETIDTRANGHFEVAKKIGQKYCVDYKSLVNWKNDFLDICGKINIHTDIPTMEFNKEDAEKYIVIFLLLDGILLGTLDTDLATVYSDGCSDLAYKEGGMSITAYPPSGTAIVTDQVTHYETTGKQEVYTSYSWFRVDKKIIDALVDGDIPVAIDIEELPEELQFIFGQMLQQPWFTLSEARLGGIQNRIAGLFRKLRDRAIDAATQEAMLEALEMLEQEMFDKTPKSLTIGDMGIQLAITTNQRNRIVRKYRQSKDPFFGCKCHVCNDNQANGRQLVLLGCDHVYHSECYDAFVDAQSGKKTQIGCAACKNLAGNERKRLPTIVCIFTYKVKGASALRKQASRKGRVKVVKDDGLGHLPEWIREEMEAERAKKSQESKKNNPTQQRPNKAQEELRKQREEAKASKELERRRKEFMDRQTEAKKQQKKSGKK